MASRIIAFIIAEIMIFGLTCLGVLFFALQFGFEWSFLLCVCIWMALNAGRWMVGSDDR